MAGGYLFEELAQGRYAIEVASRGLESQTRIVDVNSEQQRERLLPAIATASDVVTTIQFLQQAAAVLAIPVAISEQYPQGLGHTVATIRDASPAAEIFEKLRFSAANEFAAAVPLDRHLTFNNNHNNNMYS